MKHARPDYDRIQDPWNKIPEDEPVFIIRGQDVSGPAALRYWAMRNEKAGGDLSLSIAAFKQAREMERWQRTHGGKPADAARDALRRDDIVALRKQDEPADEERGERSARRAKGGSDA